MTEPTTENTYPTIGCFDCGGLRGFHYPHDDMRRAMAVFACEGVPSSRLMHLKLRHLFAALDQLRDFRTLAWETYKSRYGIPYPGPLLPPATLHDELLRAVFIATPLATEGTP